MPQAASRDRALALLDRFPLIDLHNDLPWVIRAVAQGDVRAYDLTREHPESDTDIPRMRRGRMAAQFFAAFVPTSAPHSARTTLEQIDIAREIALANPADFELARRADDVARIRAEGRIAIFVTVESGVGLENALGPLRIWHAAGVRLLTLCHNETLDWIDSATDAPRVPSGLSRFGEAVVAECNRLGILVDLAHVAPHAMHRVLDVTAAPVVWSHANAFSLCDHPRNVPDDVLARVMANGGLVCPTFIPEFLSMESWAYVKEFKHYGKTRSDVAIEQALGAKERRAGRWPRASLTDLLDHIDYLRDRIGVAHLGIGSDFFGGPTPDGLKDVACFPDVIAGLIERGYSDEDIGGIAGGNLLRVMGKAEAVAAERAAQAPRTGRIEDYDN
jgi:membrane dipeptidase